MSKPPDIPRATYRLQLNADFTFADTTAIVPYLAALGVSHLYVSPFLKARAGSTHGYDIIDHNALNPEIGDQREFDRLCASLADHGMGIIMDFVPNHMGVGGHDNLWWLDVLEWGADSPFASYFDIDWRPARPEMRGKILLPFLGEHYGVILEKGELIPKLDREDGSLSVWYWDHRYPIAPNHYSGILEPVALALQDQELDDIVLSGRALVSGRHGARAVGARRRLAAELKSRLAALVRDKPAVGDAIDAELAALGQDFPRLHALLEQQHYRISYWRVAADEINYRRFFDINDLAGLRVEDREVFEHIHKLVFDLLRQGRIHGLRIDHIDGLHNPAQYCRQLQARSDEITGRPLYLLVEKILAHHEKLRRDWAVSGETGYQFMNLVNGLFVDSGAEAQLDKTYRDFIGRRMDFEAEVLAGKKLIIQNNMASELRVLAGDLGRIAESHWLSRDFTLSALVDVLAEVVAAFPVYRTYVTARRLTETDRRYVDWAVAAARRNSGNAPDSSYFDFLHSILTAEALRAEFKSGRRRRYSRAAVIGFIMKLQQYSGPVMAKGFEDTALYRYNRLVSVNEVGGEPTRFGVSIQAFHMENRKRLRQHPHEMLATATHDSKRGEDMRLRIDAITEMPAEWRQRVERWALLNKPFKTQIDGAEAPDANDEYWLYQTLIGAWPFEQAEIADFVERVCAVAVKSMREAKQNTSWWNPNEAYEAAMTDFIHRICETERRNPFLDDFLPFQGRIAQLAMVSGLSQTLLKLTAPGLPDIYQGAELWHLAMVDPDNRRPVDYARRRDVLEQIGQRSVEDMLAGWTDGGIKLHVIRRALELRRDHPDLFESGDYHAVGIRGRAGRGLCAFARSLGAKGVIVAAPLLHSRLWGQDEETPPIGDAWRGVSIEVPRRLAGRSWRNVLTGEDIGVTIRRGVPLIAAREAFAKLPVALLIAQPEDPEGRSETQ